MCCVALRCMIIQLVALVLGAVLVRRLGVAPYTMPFQFSTWIWLLGAQRYAYFPSNDLISPHLLTV